MKNKILLTGLILLLLVIGYIFCFSTTKTKEIKEQIVYLENSNNLLKHSLYQTVMYGKETINSTIKTSEGIVPLSKIIDMNTIVFRFSENSCNSCLKRELSNISHIEKQGIPVLIIATYSNKRELRLLLEKYDIKSKYLLLDAKQYLFAFEDVSSDLFLFILTPGLQVNYLFFPVQTDTSLSYEYFKFIEFIYKENRR